MAIASAFGQGNSWHISVLVPARNEAALLPRCLSSIARARLALPPLVTSDVVVVDDNSTDGTRAIAERILKTDGTVLTSSNEVVGEARALAAKAAIARYTGRSDRHWLANTDADCCVPETWLCDQFAFMVKNVQAIAGIVRVDDFSEHEPEVAERFRATYLVYPDGSHPHVHGANLGVRADAYLLAGGWNSLETAEDHDLWKRLQNGGSVCMSVSAIHVTTSGRRVGRAPLGFAQALAAHNSQIASSVA